MSDSQQMSSHENGIERRDDDESSPDRARPHVLLIEDYLDLAEILALTLDDAGYEVTVTPSGLEGLLESSRTRFDLVLLDLNVKDLSGPGVQRAISDLNRVPVIVMSARYGAWLREAFDAGATACVPKPFNVEDLLSLIQSILLAERSTPELKTDVRELSAQDLERIRGMSREELDALPYGIIRLTRDGRIATYNEFEAQTTRYSSAIVQGMRFADVAPCTEVKEFLNAVQHARDHRKLDEVLRFHFPHRGAQALVSVRLYFDAEQDMLWLFVSKRRGEPSERV